MKTYAILAIFSIFLILAGCSSTKSAAEYDDVYYSATKDKSAPDKNEMQTATPDYYTSDNTNSDHNIGDYETGDNAAYDNQSVNSENGSGGNPDGAANITNNYYGGSGYDDYYDYSYASRINRFYGPSIGFNYYSPYYTGYYYDPWYWNSYSYMPSFYFGLSWGWGSFGYGYPYYYSPYYYSYYYPYYDYGYGYYGGYYGCNYYPYVDNGYYYGHRPTRGGSNSPITGRNSYYSNSVSQITTGRPSSLDVNKEPANGNNIRCVHPPFRKEIILLRSVQILLRKPVC